MNYIKIGEKEYCLKLVYNQQRAWQEKHGKTFQDLGDNIPFDECLSLVYHALVGGAFVSRTELDIKEEDLGNMLDQGEVIKYVQMVVMDISKSVKDVANADESKKK